MYRIQMTLALAAFTGPGGSSSGSTWFRPEPVVVVEPADPARMPPPWLQGDPADSLYRTAREMLTRRDYRGAASLFAQIPARFPRSGYAADALYWQAFALYRVGGDRDLRQALVALRGQRERFPRAATYGDAATLERRIQGELARRGDSEAAAAVTAAATSAASPSASSSSSTATSTGVVAVPPTPPLPPTPPAPPTHGVPHGSDGCAEADDDMKVAALNALQQMDEAKARPILRRVLARRDPASACLRRKAVFLIAQQDAQGTEDILLESARSDPDAEVRSQAVFWLSQVGTERAIGALDSILRFSQDSEIQDKAVFALSQHESPRAQQALRTFAERAETPEAAREKAIFWLGRSETPENATFLQSLYGRLKSDELKKRVLLSLSQMGGEANGRWLLGIARDSSQGMEVRKQALFRAGQGGVSIAELTRLYSNVSDREMREQLIFVYSQRDEPAALEKLIEIAKRDPNPELRKRALFWLGQSDDSRAVQAIQDIIDQP
jgi:HEAT repeat protein